MTRPRPATRRLSTALLTLPLATLAVTAPAVAASAHAGDPPEVDVARWSSQTAIVSWVERDDTDRHGRPGNVHVGGILAERNHGVTDVFGMLTDYRCEPGQVLGGEGEAGCTALVTSELVHDGATLTVDRATGTAHLAGAVRLLDIQGELPEERLAVDLTWTTTDRPTRERDAGIERTPTGWVRHDVVTTTWQPVSTIGTVGGFVLGDEAGDVTESKRFAVDGRLVTWSRGEAPPPDDDGLG